MLHTSLLRYNVPLPTLQGYRHHNAYIATQCPMQTTVSDFWRMMWEFKSKVIVMLCNMMEEGEEACYPYWPTRERQTVKYGNIIVTLMSSEIESADDYIIRKFTIQDHSMVGD